MNVRDNPLLRAGNPAWMEDMTDACSWLTRRVWRLWKLRAMPPDQICRVLNIDCEAVEVILELKKFAILPKWHKKEKDKQRKAEKRQRLREGVGNRLVSPKVIEKEYGELVWWHWKAMQIESRLCDQHDFEEGGARLICRVCLANHDMPAGHLGVAALAAGTRCSHIDHMTPDTYFRRLTRPGDSVLPVNG